MNLILFLATQFPKLLNYPKFALIKTKLTDSGKGNVYYLERHSASEKNANLSKI